MSAIDVAKSRQRKKKKFVDAFGGRCQICGYDKCIDALHFHHVNPADKKWCPSDAINKHKYEDTVKELEKCILLCANCHAEVHSKPKHDLFKYIEPWIDVQCKTCLKAFKTKRPEQIYCSDNCSQISQWKVKERPSKELLLELLDKMSMVRIGKMYGVSDNTIRKWSKYHNILDFCRKKKVT